MLICMMFNSPTHTSLSQSPGRSEINERHRSANKAHPLLHPYPRILSLSPAWRNAQPLAVHALTESTGPPVLHKSNVGAGTISSPATALRV